MRAVVDVGVVVTVCVMVEPEIITTIWLVIGSVVALDDDVVVDEGEGVDDMVDVVEIASDDEVVWEVGSAVVDGCSVLLASGFEFDAVPDGCRLRVMYPNRPRVWFPQWSDFQAGQGSLHSLTGTWSAGR